ncbi:MAG TPA: hypothetical protein PKA57_08180 [Parvibaculum sp.]|uniref:hypothetical protein n=1 Tax=Parvibaculum sp. TaxID=2024848 RepID=UPI002D05CAD3|nr:hypothetical protein [Parvibaculum sp.]HMM14596.1 hypothetical protein [Parvibaculum sp.]
MKKIAATFALSAMILCGGIGALAAAEDFDPNALPRDETTLKRLNDVQLGMLRAAVRHCGGFYTARHGNNFCVTSNVDLDVRQSGDAALKAFHFGLPPMDRYDENRSLVGVNRIFGPKL